MNERFWAYEEREAFKVMRKAIQKKPWMLEELLKGLSEEMAYNILKQVGSELTRLLEVNRAFSEAAKALIKEKPDGNQVPQCSALPEEGQCGHSDGRTVV
jgi:hypothetical protein